MMTIPQNRSKQAADFLSRHMREHEPKLEVRAEGDSADVLLFDEIGFWGTSAKAFAEAISQLKVSTIKLHINSPGGDVFDGIAMYNTLAKHKATIVVHVEGLAASAASIVAMAGDEILMAKGSFMMIHNAWAIGIGSASTMRELADVLDKIDDTIAGIYADRSGRKVSTLRALMDSETWFDAEEAVENKLADKVEDKPSARAAFDLSIYANVPVSLRASSAKPINSKREFESFLRDVGGLSNHQAKRLAARAYADGDTVRDEQIATNLKRCIEALKA